MEPTLWHAYNINKANLVPSARLQQLASWPWCTALRISIGPPKQQSENYVKFEVSLYL